MRKIGRLFIQRTGYSEEIQGFQVTKTQLLHTLDLQATKTEEIQGFQVTKTQLQHILELLLTKVPIRLPSNQNTITTHSGASINQSTNTTRRTQRYT